MKKDTIVLLKLSTGEQILGYFQHADNHKIVLNKPHVFVPSQRGLMMDTWPFGANRSESGDSVAEITQSHVLTIVEPLPSLVEAYEKFLEETYSKIEVPKRVGLVLPN